MNPRALLLPLLCLSLCAGTATAQVPRDYAITVEARAVPTDPVFRTHRLDDGGTTLCRGQSVFSNFISIAVDPADGRRVFAQNGSTSLAGPFEVQFVDGAFGRGVWGPYRRALGRRIAVGANDVFFVDGMGLGAVARPGNVNERRLVTLPKAWDLAVDSNVVYVSAFDSSAAAPIVRYDLLTRQARTVGSYRGVLSIAALGGTLWAGTDRGELLRIDPATGAVRARVTPGKGRINLLGLASDGTSIFSNGSQLWSLRDLVRPLYTSSTQIVDLAIGRAPAGTSFEFGEGCRGSDGQLPRASAVGRPTLGNAGFGVRLEQALASSAALLTVATSRRSLAGVPLPFGLDALGAPGCSVLVGQGVTLARSTSASGIATLPLPLPNNPTLRGLELDMQWTVIDGRANRLGISFSNGVVSVLD